MSDAVRTWLLCVLACSVVYGCDTKLGMKPIRTKPAAAAAHPKAAPKDAGAKGSADQADTDAAEDEPPAATETDAGEESTVREDDESKDAPKPTKDPAKEPGDKPGKDPMGEDPGSKPPVKPALAPVAGTAESAGCHSYTPAGNGMCGGFLCGVTHEQLAAEIKADAACSDSQYACTGNLDDVSTACARSVQATNFGASESVLRTAIRNCIFEDAQAKAHASAQCVDCFIDALVCSSGPCLIACLNGNTPQCDQCARNAGCLDPVFACSGQPSPF